VGVKHGASHEGKNKGAVFSRRSLKNIFWPMKEKENGCWREVHC